MNLYHAQMLIEHAQAEGFTARLTHSNPFRTFDYGLEVFAGDHWTSFEKSITPDDLMFKVRQVEAWTNSLLGGKK